jgi:hypothetical protein
VKPDQDGLAGHERKRLRIEIEVNDACAGGGADDGARF